MGLPQRISTLSPGTHVPTALMQDQLAQLPVGPDDEHDLRDDLPAFNNDLEMRK